MADSFFYGSDNLTVQKALNLAEGHIQGVLSDEVRLKIQASHQEVQAIVDQGKTVYGVNTGFGILAHTRISEEDTRHTSIQNSSKS
jgi:histidine ammonia-lyase